jgi:hypothetical protein
LGNAGNQGVAFKQIKDGLSNTFLFGEKHVPLLTFGEGVIDSSLYNGDTVSSVRPAGPMYPLAVSERDHGWRFGSYHTGICQFVFVDGHAVAISVGIDQTTLGLLADRADGKNTPSF